MLRNGVMPMPPAISTAARAGSWCSVMLPAGPTSLTFVPSGRALSARLKPLPSRMRVSTASSSSNGALASENVRRMLLGSAGGSSSVKLADWPGLKSNPAGFAKRNAMVPSASSSRPVKATSWRAMSEGTDFRELVRRLVALAVLVVPVQLPRLLVEGELVRAIAERLVLRKAAPAEPLLLAVDHVRGGFMGGALHDACHGDAPLVSPHWMTRHVKAFLRVQGDASVFVASLTHRAWLEDPALADPLEGVLEHFPGVGLEHDALARSPAAGVDLGEEALRELVAVVLRVELRAQVDVALRKAQRGEEFPEVRGRGLAGDHRRHHERRVDDLAEAELLEEVVRPGEERCGRDFAVDELLQPRE